MKNKYLEEALPVRGSSSTWFLVELRPHVSSYLLNKDSEGAIENVHINGGVRIKRIDFRENVRAFFPQGQSKLSIIMRRPYLATHR